MRHALSVHIVSLPTEVYLLLSSNDECWSREIKSAHVTLSENWRSQEIKMGPCNARHEPIDLAFPAVI